MPECNPRIPDITGNRRQTAKGLNMNTYDFDVPADRHNTDCLKYDFAAERHKPADALPFWVADMDFSTAPEIIEAVIQRTRHGIFGYTDVKDHYYDAVACWYTTRFGYTPARESLIVTPGIVFALCCALYACTKPGDAVLIQPPVYYPFRQSIAAQERRVITSALVNNSGRYETDFADFEKKIRDNKVKLFVLCSPHNPVGRVWKREELERTAEICLRYGVTIFADEIHSDFVFGENRHTPLPSLSKEVEKITVWGTAPTKTFNLAGLQISDIFIADRDLNRAFHKALDASGYSQPNALGLTAAEAAYRDGGPWFDAVKAYIEINMEKTAAFFREKKTRITTEKTEGTYLMWLDCRQLGLAPDVLDDLVLNRAKLWLDSGRIFGKEGEGFQRINTACPWTCLEKGIGQLAAAVQA